MVRIPCDSTVFECFYCTLIEQLTVGSKKAGEVSEHHDSEHVRSFPNSLLFIQRRHGHARLALSDRVAVALTVVDCAALEGVAG